ncbi:MAG: hypothetical protein ABWX92_04405 [Mycetocola sp.]
MRDSTNTPPSAAPKPRLLPLDAYPDDVDEAGRDRIDKKLCEEMPTIPTEPGDYLDNEDAPWTLGADGLWTDRHGATRPGGYTPLLWFFGPWTRVEKPEVTPRVHVTTEAALPVGTAVYKAREGGRKGTVLGHLDGGTVGIRWEGGGTSSGPVHFGFWVEVKPQPEEASLADG